MKGGLRVNGEDMSRLYQHNIDLGAGGVAFYSGKAENDSTLEARLWIDAIVNDKDPVVLPQQAYIVSLILEAIYESARTGDAVKL
jgi:predicted dehydrogenase